MRTLVSFRTDDATDLASWFAGRLRARGYVVTEKIAQDERGWTLAFRAGNDKFTFVLSQRAGNEWLGCVERKRGLFGQRRMLPAGPLAIHHALIDPRVQRPAWHHAEGDKGAPHPSVP
ncbi:MAG TPA: hypothetical protein VF618_05985 [Thermoanaerobaculia bacterium]